MSDPVTTRPRPTAPPVYRRPGASRKVTEVKARGWGLDDIIDAVFFAVAAAATLWLAWLLIGSGWHLDPWLALNSVLFWAVLAYLAIPRVHQVLTWLYVPDYFIGRTRTPDGLLGDPVNLAVHGDEDDIHAAMRAAGWVRADAITPRSALRIVVSSLLRRSYPAAPVSTLVLFGRGQDFAYQKEVEGNPSQRHHVRFWHTPAGWVLPGGRSVDWLAGATYDRSVGLSALTFQVTHKIDADIDIERNFVVDDVRWANAEADLGVWPDFFTAYHDKNGGGDRVETDGDLYVLDLDAVVPESVDSVELARARAADAQANRQRPPQLLVALILIMLLVGVQSAQLIRDPDVGSAAADLAGEGVAGATGLVYGVVSFFSAAMIATVAALGLAAWHGHPRGRIALLATLTLAVLTDMSQVSAVGVRAATASLIVTSGLEVLALLALTARPVQRWERSRKAERQAQATARSGNWGLRR
ncbi:LssY C-terminal domain-containing protein [Actinomyces massiliensis]|uniref:LssY C-terminal domain-containing protein n=1 Tax=Actinomyces massiliensis TaxID=461393 RepID=UPI00069685D1|nr:LssY C-terminal domain-containing protein [Actinomyces massiliensis]WLD71559.1 LssY C-terminal domain-containing protein [Actinomyces massiliensis]